MLCDAASVEIAQVTVTDLSPARADTPVGTSGMATGEVLVSTTAGSSPAGGGPAARWEAQVVRKRGKARNKRTQK
jgi:hypothetical protein